MSLDLWLIMASSMPPSSVLDLWAASKHGVVPKAQAADMQEPAVFAAAVLLLVVETVANQASVRGDPGTTCALRLLLIPLAALALALGDLLLVAAQRARRS